MAGCALKSAAGFYLAEFDPESGGFSPVIHASQILENRRARNTARGHPLRYIRAFFSVENGSAMKFGCSEFGAIQVTARDAGAGDRRSRQDQPLLCRLQILVN